MIKFLNFIPKIILYAVLFLISWVVSTFIFGYFASHGFALNFSGYASNSNGIFLYGFPFRWIRTSSITHQPNWAYCIDTVLFYVFAAILALILFMILNKIWHILTDKRPALKKFILWSGIIICIIIASWDFWNSYWYNKYYKTASFLANNTPDPNTQPPKTLEIADKNIRILWSSYETTFKNTDFFLTQNGQSKNITPGEYFTKQAWVFDKYTFYRSGTVLVATDNQTGKESVLAVSKNGEFGDVFLSQDESKVIYTDSNISEGKEDAQVYIYDFQTKEKSNITELKGGLYEGFMFANWTGDKVLITGNSGDAGYGRTVIYELDLNIKDLKKIKTFIYDEDSRDTFIKLSNDAKFVYFKTDVEAKAEDNFYTKSIKLEKYNLATGETSLVYEIKNLPDKKIINDMSIIFYIDNTENIFYKIRKIDNNGVALADSGLYQIVNSEAQKMDLEINLDDVTIDHIGDGYLIFEDFLYSNNDKPRKNQVFIYNFKTKTIDKLFEDTDKLTNFRLLKLLD